MNTNIINRPNINKQLEKALTVPLYVVYAPMGYGKTTAVREYMRRNSFHEAWLSLYTDSTPESMWSNLCSEIKKFNPSLGEELIITGYPYDEIITSKIIEIFHKNEFDQHTFIILDDFHTVKNKHIIHLIKSIVRLNKLNLHVIIITRKFNFEDFFDVCAGMEKLTQNDLVFTKKEIKKLASNLKIILNDTDISNIEDLSKGWISLVYMLIKDKGKGIIVDKNTTVTQIIKTAIYDEYNDYTKEILLILSLFEHSSVEQAKYMLGTDNIKNVLNDLYTNNSFISYDETQNQYIIHSVFREFLLLKLKKSEKNISALYERAGKWFLHNNDYINAFRYYKQSDSIENFFKEKNNKQPMHLFTLPDFIYKELTMVDEQYYIKYPYAFLDFGCQLMLGDDDSQKEFGANMIMTIQQKAIDSPHVYGDNASIVLGECYAANMFMCFNDAEAMYHCMVNARELLGDTQSRIIERNTEFTFGTPHLLYCYYKSIGDFYNITTVFTEKVSKFPSLADGCGAGNEYIALSEYNLEIGKFDLAETYAYKGIYKARSKQQFGLELCAVFVLLRINLYRGNKKEITSLVDETQKQLHNYKGHILGTTFDLIKGYVYSIMGETDKIPRWLMETDGINPEHRVIGMCFFNVVNSKVLLCLGDINALDVDTEIAPLMYEKFNNQLGYIYNTIHKCIAKYKQNEIEVANALLIEALDMCRADNIIMPLVESVEYILDILDDVKSQYQYKFFFNRVYTNCKTYKNSLWLIKGSVPLTKKEKEVLKLLAKGNSREQISNHMHTSINTTKKHINSIYKKLKVNNRVSAIEKAAKMGFLK